MFANSLQAVMELLVKHCPCLIVINVLTGQKKLMPGSVFKLFSSPIPSPFNFPQLSSLISGAPLELFWLREL